MVANAGIAVTASLLETTAEQSQRTPDVNFTGVAHCYSATAERHPARIRDGGRGRRDPAGTEWRRSWPRPMRATSPASRSSSTAARGWP